MFYEERFTNGMFMFRNAPLGKWQQLDIHKLSKRLFEAEAKINELERLKEVVSDVRTQAYINGKNYEKDRIKELLGLCD